MSLITDKVFYNALRSNTALMEQVGGRIESTSIPVPDEQLESFAKNILSQEEQGRRILDQVENEKTIAAVRDLVTLKKKKISVDKFRDLE